MKNLLILFCAASAFNAFAQENPFEEFGYTPKIATLSGGKYIEYFDRDTLVQIGALIYNTKAGKIAGFVVEDTSRSEATLEPDVVSRWISPDPMAYMRAWVSPYNFVQNNPINRVDPNGALDAPIYDQDGAFLGTDDEGLLGKAIVMNRSDFTQGMSHSDALSKNLGANGLSSDAAKSSLLSHYSGLKDRPDYDGFVTIDEGVGWAKERPNTLNNNNPDDALYLNASKLNFGELSVANSGLREGHTRSINLFDFTDWSSGSSRATTYALGNTKIELINATDGTVRLFWDDYDWDFHNYPFSRRMSGQLPESTRDRLIFFERQRSGVDDSHGFRVNMYGTGTIKAN